MFEYVNDLMMASTEGRNMTSAM